MLKIHKQTRAERDLIDIWLYSFQTWGEAQADKYHDELTNAFAAIAENPLIGISCEDVRQGYRKYHVHLIFYRIAEDTLRIVRVLGEDMDYPQHV